MKDKIIAIWRIIRSNEYILIASTGISAAYGKSNLGVLIRNIANLIPEELRPK